MERHSRRRATAGATLVGATALLLALPVFSSAGLLQDVQRGVEQTLSPVQQTLERALTPPAQQPANPPAAAPKPAPAPVPAAAPQPAQTPGQGGYTPPLHGNNPHGQGGVAVVDIQPSDQRPLSGDPAGGADPDQREEVVVGRARGEQQQDGDYHGHITIVSLFGNEVLGVDTSEGETAAGPLDAVQTGILDQLCTASSVCLDVLRADSSTTDTGSTNSFAVARASVGGATGINLTAAESNGSISEDANCQTSRGDSTVANLNIGGTAVADAATASSESRACNDGTQSQSVDGRVIGLGGAAIPLPAAGCGDGTANTAFTPLAPLASIVCNATDVNGTQADDPYGVREALTAFVLEAGGSSLLKVTAARGESHAIAPANFPPGTPPETEQPQCSDGIDNDGDGLIDLADPDCDSPQDDSEADGDGPGGPDAPGEERDGDGDGDGDGTGDGDRGADGDPECSDGIDNDGDGRIDFPDDPQCESRSDDSEGDGGIAGATARGDGDALPVTGVELLLIALLGAVTLAGGLTLRRLVERGEGHSAA